MNDAHLRMSKAWNWWHQIVLELKVSSRNLSLKEKKKGLAESYLRSDWVAKFSPLPHPLESTSPQLSGSEVFYLNRVENRGSLGWKKPSRAKDQGNPPKPKGFSGHMKCEY